MTVSELLARIIAAYPGATTDAMKTFKPVFYARLQRHEGDKLEEAATAVLGSFRPKYGQPFPIPADFEAHLPSGRLDLGKGSGDAGPPIRQWLADRDARRKRNYEDWTNGQGAKIKANRPHAVYSACVLMATELAAQRRDRLVLSAEQIARCEEQALSRARVEMFGPPPKSDEAWRAQLDQVREAWAANPNPVAARLKSAA
ncbi:MAG TPA: hypothetical protein VGE09_08450 [Pseudoxanthomonas sp.]